MKLFLIAVLISVAPLGGLRADETIEQSAVRAADEVRIAAMRDGNRNALEEIFSNQLRYAHSSGTIDTKASFIDVLTSGKTKYLAYEHVERGFTFPAPGMALMSGKAKVKVSSEKGEMDLVLAYLAVWREENGKWRFLAWQSCRLPQ